MPFDAGVIPSQISLDLQTIRDAREQIAIPGMWCKESLSTLYQHCAIGWLVEFCGPASAEKIAETYFNPVLPHRYTRAHPKGWSAVMVYNDRRKTKQSDIVALFDKVIQNLENQNAV